jgi:hypothetical protein
MSTKQTTPRTPDDADSIDSALAILRRDLGTARPAPGLADRVLAAARRGDAETLRFRRYARAYGAAAALLLALGTAGAVALRRPPPDPRGTLADLEATRMALEQAVSVADLAVGGR